jgi:hypothetical protein
MGVSHLGIRLSGPELGGQDSSLLRDFDEQIIVGPVRLEV